MCVCVCVGGVPVFRPLGVREGDRVSASNAAEGPEALPLMGQRGQRLCL